jgi:hypothetical protein
MPHYIVTLSLQPPTPLDVDYHRALLRQLVAIVPASRQPPSSLTAGVYRIRVALTADTEQAATERARTAVATAAAQADRPLHHELAAHVTVTST